MKNQIFVKSLDDYSKVKITDEKEGISNFKWDPTGKGFIILHSQKNVRK